MKFKFGNITIFYSFTNISELLLLFSPFFTSAVSFWQREKKFLVIQKWKHLIMKWWMGECNSHKLWPLGNISGDVFWWFSVEEIRNDHLTFELGKFETIKAIGSIKLIVMTQMSFNAWINCISWKTLNFHLSFQKRFVGKLFPNNNNTF